MAAVPWLGDVTDREIEVLVAYCTAQGTKAAAKSLGISPHTVRNHLAVLRDKLGVSTTAAAVFILRERLP
jgi:DNA-binding CsgD family transcriptional regulator